MNLCINNKCNQNCEFCFQYKFHKDYYNDMSLDLIKKFLDKFPEEQGIGILGGEPTLHPDIIEILNLMSKRFSPFTLMTNLHIYDLRIIGTIINTKNITLLVNGNCFNGKSKIFDKNFNELLKYKNIHLGYTITNSTTIDDFSFIFDYIEQDKNNKISLRLSPNMNTDNFEFNKENFNSVLNELILYMAKYYNDVIISLDCSMNYCFYDEDTFYEILMNYPNLKYNKECMGAIDVLPDMSAIWCSNFYTDPMFKIKNIFDFNSSMEIRDHFKKIFELYNPKSVQCVNCDKTYACKGLCPALNNYFKNSEFTI